MRTLRFPEPIEYPDASPSIPLAEAALCLDCEHLYLLREYACPNCGSGKSATPARWLGVER